MSRLRFGKAPVPFTVCWSAEDAFVLGADPVVPGHISLNNAVAPGEGQPRFGSPHMQRQREAVANGLCDICGLPLRNHSKVSLSKAKVRNGANGLCVMQVEPLLHKPCAARSLEHCPSLRRDIRNGTLHVRLVTRYHVEFATLTADAVEEFTGQRRSGAVGHAKIVLEKWRDKNATWLRGASR